MKQVLTVTGIRPDFIRMSEIFKKLDSCRNICHILVHSGQHYDKMLSDIFFDNLSIRKPDYNLSIGNDKIDHITLSSSVAKSLLEFIKDEKLHPDVILFLGDSNTVLSAPFLKKEGLRIGHIEAGMRSYDMRMLEEINRKVCDHVSDILFTYHQDYKEILLKEGIDKDIHVVGNTIVEPCSIYSKQFVEKPSFERHIVLDIHRPENFKSAIRLANIFDFARGCGSRYDLPVKMIDFKRALFYLDEFGIDTDGIEHLDVMSYTDYLEFQYNAYCIISDSGTAQEEPALLKVPVIVPRDYTERPQSMENNCSVLVNVNSRNDSWTEAFTWLDYIKYDKNKINSSWLGDGTASKQIVDTLKTWL